MKFWIGCDIDWETRVDSVRDELIALHFEPSFEGDQYGPGIEMIAILLTCRDPSHKFRQRTKWIADERILETDILLPHSEMIAATPEQRRTILVQALLNEVPRVIEKKKVSDFDSGLLAASMKEFFVKAKWIS
jgi:hypothetical protein